MEFTWHPTFKPFLKYSAPACLPPYTSSTKWGYFKTLAIFILAVRAILLLLLEPTALSEKFYMVSINAQIFLRGCVLLYERKLFDKYSYEINKYINDGKHNPIINDEDVFLKIWSKNHCFKHAHGYFTVVATVWILWKFPVFYHLIFNVENVHHPFYPVYSPGFDYNSATKWIWTIADIAWDWNAAFSTIQCEMILLSLLNFAHCQFLYLKKLLNALYDKGCDKQNDPKIVKWWIESHCLVTRLTNDLIQLLAPVIAINYVFLIACVASCIVELIEDNAHQSALQKYTLLFFLLLILFQIGCHCRTMENLNELSGTLYEDLEPLHTVNEKLKVNIICRMINFTAQNPINMSGLGFFTFNNKEYKDLLFTTYSFYSSLLSLNGRTT